MRGGRATGVLVALAALLALGSFADAALGEDQEQPVTEMSSLQATSGAWICMPGNRSADAATTVLAAVPARDEADPAPVSYRRFGDGASEALTGSWVVPGSANAVGVGSQPALSGIVARWQDEPTAVFRLSRTTEVGPVGGRLEGPCIETSSRRWIVPGVATAGGAQAELVLANPFATDATASVALTTLQGAVEPRLLENVVVPHDSVLVVPLNRHAPEQSDLGVVVRVHSGRVLAEGVQRFNAAIGGVEGRSVVSAAPAPAERWTVPWTTVGSESASWLWVTNVEDRPAAVGLTLHAASGGTIPEGAEELTIPPMSTRRIDLDDLAPAGAVDVAVTVESDNGVPIAVNLVSQRVPEEVERTGAAVQLGAVAADDTWTLATGVEAGRQVLVDLVNPAGGEAVVDVTIAAGGRLIEPLSLRGIVVAPGAAVSLDLTTSIPVGAEHAAVFVRASQGQVVAGLHAFAGTGRADYVVSQGIPGAVWLSSVAHGPASHRPDLSQHIGTSTGPRPDTGGLLDDLDPSLPDELGPSLLDDVGEAGDVDSPAATEG